MVDRAEVPSVTAAQMREVDRITVGDLGVDLLQMMENAGRALAELTRIELGGLSRRKVVVLAGRGGNGGGGMAAARRLAIWGADVRVVLARPERDLADAPAHQLRALRAIGVPLFLPSDAPAQLQQAEVILDALLGYGLEGAPREPEAGLIRGANARGAPVLALDLPSGLDPDSGTPHDPTIRARGTLCLALPKVGELRPGAAAHVGELWLADISVPPHAFARFGLDIRTLFEGSDLIPLRVKSSA